MTILTKKMATLSRLTLEADTAEDLMSANPISLRCDAEVREAIVLLTDRNFNAAPVIDEKGRPVGVVTITDLLVHDREYVRFLKTRDMTPRNDLQNLGENFAGEVGVEVVDRTRVDEIMTPAVFTVTVHAPAPEVLRRMLNLNVHHLFVADSDGVLVGVISTCDILRRLA